MRKFVEILVHLSVGFLILSVKENRFYYAKGFQSGPEFFSSELNYTKSFSPNEKALYSVLNYYPNHLSACQEDFCVLKPVFFELIISLKINYWNSTFYYTICLLLRFTKEEVEARKQAIPFVPARYISALLTLYPKYVAFYREGVNFRLSVFFVSQLKTEIIS